MAADLLPHPGALTVNGQSMGTNCEARLYLNGDVIRTAENPLVEAAGFINLATFDSAIMKTR